METAVLTEFFIPVIGMLVSFGLPLVLVAIVLYYKHRRLRIQHETIARLLEKGIPVPPELLRPPAPSTAQSALRGGLVLVALGLGLGIFFAERGGPWSIGLIPGLMGAALLIAWKIEGGSRNRTPPQA